jgi:lysophospholipase L1-like esterase
MAGQLSTVARARLRARCRPRKAQGRAFALAVALLGCALPALAALATCDAALVWPPAGGQVLVLAEGDSITFGQGATDGRSYVGHSCLLVKPGVVAKDTAVSQAVLGGPADPAGANSLYGRMASDNALLRTAGDRATLLTVLIGRNDLVGYGGGAQGYADALAAYVGRMRGAGWQHVAIGTLLPSDWAPFTAQRAALNAILRRPGWARAHGIDAIFDLAASPSMGPDAAARDKALFRDGIHPTDEGYAALAPIYDAALVRLVRAPVR